TVQRDYPDSLFFLAPALADTTIATNDHSREIELFLTNPSADDVDVSVKNVTLTELTAPPYRAAIDFEKSYYSQGTRQERKHETYIAQVQFNLRDAVPNAFIRVNPLGMQITNFRVDQAFDQ
ncbi:MAG: VirB8/TrbF family protein, partial [Terriglobales bacterium]